MQQGWNNPGQGQGQPRPPANNQYVPLQQNQNQIQGGRGQQANQMGMAFDFNRIS
jgi:hypothetical protein